MADAGRIIPIHKGDWTIHDAYEVLDQVYYAGSTYIAKNNIADSATTPNVDTTNWILSARGFDADTLAGVTGIDTSGVLGTIGATVSGQALIDEIADRVATKLLPISNLANNGTTTEIGQYALDANYGKTLTDELVTVNINLDDKVSKNELFVSVKAYGAKGDGVTDDTQAFIDALSENKSVYVPFTSDGYVIGSLTIQDGQSLIGDQQKTILKLKTGTDWCTVHGTNIAVKNFRILANNMSGSLFVIDTANITCTYLNFDNIFAYQATTILKDNGGTNQITSLYVKNITSSLQKGDAYILTKAEAFTFFKNVTVDYATAGASLNNTAFHLTNNNGAIFEDCDVLGSASNGLNTNQKGYVFDSCQAIWLIRCMADTLDGVGFHIKGSAKYVYFVSCVGSACSGHQFFIENGIDIKFTNGYAGGRKGLTGALADMDGINIQSGANKVIITGMRITNCTRDGIRSDSASFINANCLEIDSNGGYAIHTTGSGSGLYSNIMSLGNTLGNYNIGSAYEYIRNIYKGDATMTDSVNGVNIG